MIEHEIRFTASENSGEVGAILMRPEDARWLMVLAHGAGAGIRHAFMTGLAQSLAEHGIASFRYQFPYIDAADHSFHVPKKSGRTDEDVLEELGKVVADWASSL